MEVSYLNTKSSSLSLIPDVSTSRRKLTHSSIIDGRLSASASIEQNGSISRDDFSDSRYRSVKNAKRGTIIPALAVLGDIMKTDE